MYGKKIKDLLIKVVFIVFITIAEKYMEITLYTKCVQNNTSL